jgi:hypothetical protein
MTHTVLAVTHPNGAASAVGSGTHWFAIGLLVGMAAIRIAPGWLTALIITFDIVALGWSFGILHYADTGSGRWVLIAVLFLLIGLFIGAIRGLRLLGDHEYLTRRNGMRARGWWI